MNPTWRQSRTPLSKRCENSRLILFYKIINSLAVAPHSCLEKADVRTRKKHSQKFRHIGYNIDPYVSTTTLVLFQDRHNVQYIAFLGIYSSVFYSLKGSIENRFFNFFAYIVFLNADFNIFT